MTTGDWLGLVCLAGLIGFFAGGFFVYQLFFKRMVEAEQDDESEMEDQATRNKQESID